MENEKTQLKAENLCCLPVLNINSSFKEMSSAKNFADRRSSLFGRKADADFLVNRVLHFGLTAVAGRPKMGKTWLLEECGRRLADNGYPSDRFVEDRYARVIWYALQMAKKHNQLDRVELLQIEQRRLAKHSKFGEIGA